MEENTETKAAPEAPTTKKRGKRTKTTRKKRTAAAKRKPRSGSKHDLIVWLVSRNGGASLSVIMKAAGWQAHSVRGFLSILGKTMKVESEREGEERIYRAR
jgi:hypothetical protein